MLGVELVKDRELKTPAKAEILHIMDEMRGTFPESSSFLYFFSYIFITS